MVRGDEKRREGGAPAGGLALGCLLALVMLATHLALMASPTHAEMATRSHGAVAPAMALAVGGVIAHNADPPPAPHAPRPAREDCATGAAILPAVPLTLALLVAIGAAHAGRAIGGGVRAWPRGVSFSLPPPLAPARRRALLQVFRN